MNLRPDELRRQRQDAAVIRFLSRNIDAIRQDEVAGEIHRQIHKLRDRVERIIDNRDPDVYYGPCQATVVEADERSGVIAIQLSDRCGADLMGQLGDTSVECARCGSEWLTADLLQMSDGKARDAWARLSVVVGAVRAFGYDVSLQRIEKWVSRDRAEQDAGRRRRVPYPPILQRGVDDDGRPVFRVGDFLDRLDVLAAIAEERRGMSA